MSRAVLSAENWQQLWVPAGFLHGFCTLEPDTEVLYKVTAVYDRAAERGVIWNDPDLALPWPVAPGEAVLSDKDAGAARVSPPPRAGSTRDDHPRHRRQRPARHRARPRRRARGR